MDNIELTKKDDNTISVVKVVPVTFEFTYDYLISQREAILAQKARDNEQRDLELAEVDEYLAQCKRLNVTAKSVENIEPVKEVDV